jgi:hypothetical protein
MRGRYPAGLEECIDELEGTLEDKQRLQTVERHQDSNHNRRMNMSVGRATSQKKTWSLRQILV